jgi:hypothetical protein
MNSSLLCRMRVSSFSFDFIIDLPIIFSLDPDYGFFVDDGSDSEDKADEDSQSELLFCFLHHRLTLSFSLDPDHAFLVDDGKDSEDDPVKDNQGELLFHLLAIDLPIIFSSDTDNTCTVDNGKDTEEPIQEIKGEFLFNFLRRQLTCFLSFRYGRGRC